MEHGISLVEEWVVDDREREFGTVDYQSKFVLPENMPTAFFCNCDLTAGYMIRKLEEEGLTEDTDVSLSIYLCWKVPITTKPSTFFSTGKYIRRFPRGRWAKTVLPFLKWLQERRKRDAKKFFPNVR